jgi:hypothetical protein
MQVAGAAGKAVVRSLSGLDSWLENNKLLPELKPMAVPEPVQDEDGQLNQECQEVITGPCDDQQLGLGHCGHVLREDDCIIAH